MSKLTCALALASLSACASAPVLHNVSAVTVTLVSRDESARPAVAPERAVPAEAIGAWSTCLEKLRASDVSKAIKMALTEGEYRLAITDAGGAHAFTLHNTEDLTDGGGKFYKSDCAYDLVRGLGLAP